MPESEAASAEPDEDTVLAALFATSEISPPPPRDHEKRRRGQDKYEATTRKMKHREREAGRRSLIADEEACQIRALESATGGI